MSRLDVITREVRPMLVLALPITLGQVGQILINVTDSVMIGHAGTVPLAASSFGGTLFGLMYVVGIGVLVPVPIYVARARGAAQPEEAAEYLRHGLFLATVCGLLETLVIAAICLRLSWFGQPPEVLSIVTPYLLLIGGSITPVLLYQTLRQHAEAMGRPWVPVFVILGGIGLNAGLNWVLIFGHLGAPALGLTGAGIATLIARLIATAVTFAWLRLDRQMAAAWPRHWFAPLSRARLREMLAMGIPAAGMLFFESTAFTVSTIMVGWLGAVPLAAHQIAFTCAAFSFMFPLGLSMSASIQTSRALGAREEQRVRPIAAAAIVLALAMMAVFAVAYALAGRQISTWFVLDPAVIALATQLLVVAALFQLFDGWQVTASSVLRSIGDVKIPAAITFGAYWVIALPLGYALGIRGPLGALGVWIGIASGLACAAILLTVRFGRLSAARTLRAG